MAAVDEEKGLITGQGKPTRTSAFTSPTAAIFGVVFVTFVFVGATVLSNNAPEGVDAAVVLTPVTTSAAVSSASSKIESADVDVAATGKDEASATDSLVEAMTEPIEMQLKIFLMPLKKFSTAVLLDRVRSGVGYVVEDLGDEASPELKDIMDIVDVKNNPELAAAVKELDAKDDPAWMSDDDVRRRRLLGSDSEGKDMNVMDYANTFASALKVTVDEFVELLPELAGGAAKIVAKGDGATRQERLLLAAIDLSAVAARSAPEPFGKAVKVVFDTAWSAVLEVLPFIDAKKLNDIL